MRPPRLADYRSQEQDRVERKTMSLSARMRRGPPAAEPPQMSGLFREIRMIIAAGRKHFGRAFHRRRIGGLAHRRP